MSIYKYLEFFNIGIKAKLRIIILFSSILPVILIGYYSYYFSIQTSVENIYNQDKQNVEHVIAEIQAFLADVPNHLNFLTSFYVFHENDESNKKWLISSAKEFQSFIANQKNYSSLQVIATDGQEMLHVNYESNKANIVPENKLHNEQNIDYFKNALSLKKGHLLNLKGFNDAHYSTPIIDQNHVVQGILVLTFNFKNIISYLHNTTELDNTIFHYLLFDQDNKHLYHVGDGTDEHEQHMPHNNQLKSLSLPSNQHGMLDDNNMITTYQKFRLPTGDIWTLIKQTNKNVIFEKIRYFKYIFLITIILVAMIAFLISGWFTKIFIIPLLTVNRHLKSLAHGNLTEEHIEYQKNDEIGELIISTWQLKNNFKNTIAQANAIAAGDYSKKVTLLSDQDRLGRALANMTHTLNKMTTQDKIQDWLKTGQTQLNDKMSGEQDINTLTRNIIDFITPYLKAQIGLLYLVDDNHLKL
ncbi:methyl-accepting chemotaxis protein, partial [Thiotrichales bacterium HSG1]|nr:methyl-accepting chemotaxis protein [Thiotrichales bacterium HSG1]